MTEQPLVFVNNMMETFTPTQSGALATYIVECCRAAVDGGAAAPHVISRESSAKSFDWPNLSLLPFPVTHLEAENHIRERITRRLVGLPRNGSVKWSLQVASEIRKVGGSRARVILQNDPEMAVILRSLLPRVTLVHLFQNQLPCRSPFRGSFRRSVNAVMAVSRFTADWVADFYGLGAGEVSVVYSGVNLEQFRRPSQDTDTASIGFVGRTGLEKGPDILLRAARLLSKRTTEFKVQIVGSNHWDRYEHDAYQAELETLTAELVDAGIQVIRPGHVGRNHLPEWLHRSTIHVVPSRWDEPFGLTTLEGMAAGNALVASGTGGTPEVVGDGGQLFRRDDPEDLAAKLEPLVLSDQVLSTWADRAVARAKLFPWEKTYQQLDRTSLLVEAAPTLSRSSS